MGPGLERQKVLAVRINQLIGVDIFGHMRHLADLQTRRMVWVFCITTHGSHSPSFGFKLATPVVTVQGCPNSARIT